MKPLVSIITPTGNRAEFLAHTARWVRQQTQARIEWLILDDSSVANAPLAADSDPRIRYRHVGGRLTIGEKRNRLIDEAQGAFIAHFDDDDYYAPQFLENLVSSLEGTGADFANLCSWYLFDVRHDFFGYWNLRQTTGLHYLCFADGLRVGQFNEQNNGHLRNNHLGYGFSYVYRRRVWEANPFVHLDWGEDSEFVAAAARRFRLLSVEDQTGLVLHLLHASSSSSCFPQFRLPVFLAKTLFQAFADILQELRLRRLRPQNEAPAI